MAISVLQIAYYTSLMQMRQTMLEHDGYVVTSALGNDQGMAVASSQHFDVAVVGFSSDHSPRTEMVRWLKQHVPGLPVVALLNHSLESFPEADTTTFSEDPRTWLTAVRATCVKNPG